MHILRRGHATVGTVTARATETTVPAITTERGTLDQCGRGQGEVPLRHVNRTTGPRTPDTSETAGTPGSASPSQHPTIAAIPSDSPRAPEGLIALEPVVGKDEGSAGLVDAATCRRSPRTAGACRTSTAGMVAVVPAASAGTADAAATPSSNVAADDIMVQGQAAASEVDTAALTLDAGTPGSASIAGFTYGAGRPGGSDGLIVDQAHIRERNRAAVDRETTALRGPAAGDHQAAEVGRHTAADREHLDGVVAADRKEVGAGTVDHFRSGGFGEGQRAGKRDGLRRGEDRWVELDQAAGGVRVSVGLVDAIEQVARGPRSRAGVGDRVDRVDRGRQEDAVFQALQGPEPATATSSHASRASRYAERRRQTVSMKATHGRTP